MHTTVELIFAAIVLYVLLDIRKRVGSGSKSARGSAIVMDSSALVDGRIADVIKSEFLTGAIIIPKRVLDELQLLADGRDAHKRSRARYGLEIAEQLQKTAHSRVSINESYIDADIPTDEAILKIAKQKNARLCTTDYNLNKVAAVEGVIVLNVNELAHGLRPVSLPGEVIAIKIIQNGESKGQGVGYLEDGTMAVVENAQKHKGKTINATVDRMIQTKAGKMIFATKD